MRRDGNFYPSSPVVSLPAAHWPRWRHHRVWNQTFGSHWRNQWGDVPPNGAQRKELLPKLQLHMGSVLQLNPSLKGFKTLLGFKPLFRARCVPELVGHTSQGITGITTGITNTSAGRNSAAQDRPPVPLNIWVLETSTNRNSNEGNAKWNHLLVWLALTFPGIASLLGHHFAPTLVWQLAEEVHPNRQWNACMICAGGK